MMCVCEFDVAPSKYIDIEQAKRLLNVRRSDLAEMIIENKFLKKEIDLRLRTFLEPIPKNIPAIQAKLFNHITMGSDDLLSSLSYTMAILINHKAILGATDGKILKEIIRWCGRKDLIEIIRRDGVPAFQRFAVLSNATSETLNRYALEMQQYLFGLLPSSYAQRLLLRFPLDSAPSVAFFEMDDPDRATFVDCAVRANSLVSRERSARA